MDRPQHPRAWFRLSQAGALAWALCWVLPAGGGLAARWPAMALLLAALAGVPLALGVMTRELPDGWPGLHRIRMLILPAAALLALSVLLPPGLAAGLAALPWLGITLALARTGVWRLRRTSWRDLGPQTAHAGLVFLAVGGAWAAADRLGLQVLAFPQAIVQLTAIHFHYAGLFFPLLAGLALQAWPSRAAAGACILALAAIPLTALGITAAQVLGWQVLEGLAGAAVALSGWLCAGAYLHPVLRGRLRPVQRLCWGLMGMALLFSMSLAMLYALRVWYPLPLLSIPWMRAWHGAANVFGVAGLGLLGWALKRS
ncbi:MAG: YndJ family transporter [Bacteroidia bacterium]|nr:YndJ family transporter [Bacteroidia bacterium]